MIELGLLHQLKAKAPDKAALRQLKQHLQREKAALAGTDVGLRTDLLGDFHVCLAECLGNALLADTLRDFTARTTLIAMLYQSSHDAAQSCEDHVRIVEALEAGDIARAEALMAEHIGTVQAALRLQASADPLDGLRDALAPVAPVASVSSAASAQSAPDMPGTPAATAAPAKRRGPHPLHPPVLPLAVGRRFCLPRSLAMTASLQFFCFCPAWAHAAAPWPCWPLPVWVLRCWPLPPTPRTRWTTS